MASTLPLDPAPDRAAGGNWRAGDRIGRYELVRELGAGAMGVVWCARDVDLDRNVAMKLVRPGGSPTPILRARLLREARALARSPHPNVVAIHDVGTGDGGLFIVMEYLEGDTLSEWLRSAPRPWEETVQKFIAAGRGLAHAHRVGLVHRDFKPENVILDRDGVAKVADFGLAIPVADANAGDPSDRGDSGAFSAGGGDLVGTLAFMSPEQLVGDQITARSDQFSFSVALYEALHGVRPFGAPSGGGHAAILLAAIIEGKLAPRPADRDVPEKLDALLVRGLAYEPSDRWPDMDSLLRALEQCRARGLRRPRFASASIRASTALTALGGLCRRWLAPRRVLRAAALQPGRPITSEVMRAMRNDAAEWHA